MGSERRFYMYVLSGPELRGGMPKEGIEQGRGATSKVTLVSNVGQKRRHSGSKRGGG